MTARPRVAVLDYGIGNLRSAQKALERAGAEARLVTAAADARGADGVVLPGVGAFPKAMVAVRALGFDALLADLLDAGTPALGLCMGMQLLFDSTTELGGGIGLGLLPGDVESLDSAGLKLPQIGWNAASWRRASPLVEGLPDPCAFYHVHSFAPVASEAGDVLGTAVYGSEFVTAVERAPLFGVQFHPEKSGAHRLRLLENFAGICASVRAAA